MQYLFRSSAPRHFGQDLVCKLSDQLSSSTVHGSSVLCWQLYIRHPGDILYLSINLSSSSCSFQLRRGATADSHSGARTLATATASCNQDQEIGPPKCNCIAERLRPNYAVQSGAIRLPDRGTQRRSAPSLSKGDRLTPRWSRPACRGKTSSWYLLLHSACLLCPTGSHRPLLSRLALER